MATKKIKIVLTIGKRCLFEQSVKFWTLFNFYNFVLDRVENLILLLCSILCVQRERLAGEKFWPFFFANLWRNRWDLWHYSGYLCWP